MCIQILYCMSLENAVKGKSDTTMIRVSKETRDIVDERKHQGESQSDCIKRIFQNCALNGMPFGISTNSVKPKSGFSLEGFREYHHDRNQSHVFRHLQPDYVKMYEVYLVKDGEKIVVRDVSPDDLEKMKNSKNIIILTSGMSRNAFIPSTE